MDNAEITNELKILVIDNDQWIHRILQRQFGLWSFKMFSAYDSYDAIVMSQEVDPDVIFLDYYLPEINGDIVLKIVKKFQKTRYTPVIVMSASMDKEILASTYHAGAVGFLSKPVTPQIIARKIHECLNVELFKQFCASNEEFMKHMPSEQQEIEE